MSTAKELIEAVIGEAKDPVVEPGQSVRAIWSMEDGSDIDGVLHGSKPSVVRGMTVLSGSFYSKGRRLVKYAYAGWDPHDRVWRVSDDLEVITG